MTPPMSDSNVGGKQDMASASGTGLSPTVEPVPVSPPDGASIPDAAWRRYRFCCYNEDDPRPVKWPPLGPYWISGYGDGFAILIAYMPTDTDETLEDYWPDDEPNGDAHSWWGGYDCQERAEITFSDRFPRPEWWTA